MKVYRSNKKLELTNSEWYEHFKLALGFLIPTLLLALSYFGGGDDKKTGLLFIGLLFLVLAFFLFWRDNQRLLFYEYKVKMSGDDFRKLVEATAKELGWQIGMLSDDAAVAFRAPEQLGNGGEKITIERTTYALFANSIANPERSNGHSPRRNRENVVTLFNNTQHIFKGGNIDAIIEKREIRKEEEFWEESEWTFVKIMKRLVGYGLTFLFLLIGYLVVSEGEWGGLIFILLSLGMGATYIKSDIEILIEKSKRKK